MNLFTPSVLTWSERGITVTQTTTYPASDTTTLTVTGNVGGSWTMRVRIPAWTSGATVSVNGAAQNIATTPGTYASLTRSWTAGDTVTVRLPMRVIMQAANDNPGVAAITYGPAVLAGNYGNTSLSALPTLNVGSITRTSTSSLAFTATANGATVNLGAVPRRPRLQLHRLLANLISGLPDAPSACSNGESDGHDGQPRAQQGEDVTDDTVRGRRAARRHVHDPRLVVPGRGVLL